MAQATFSCPFGAIHLEDRRGTAPDEHKVLIWSRPRRRFGDFAAAGKVTRRPQAAKLPLQNRNSPLCPPQADKILYRTDMKTGALPPDSGGNVH